MSAVPTPEAEPDGLQVGHQGDDPSAKTPAQGDSVPAGEHEVAAHPDVDLTLDDPALTDSGGRQCVTARQDGERCRAPAIGGKLLCAAHAGLLDSAAGGRALAEKRRKAKSKAEEELARRSLGTRAAIAAVLSEEQAKVETIVRDLLTRGAAGDSKAQSLLLPYLNQGLGLPTERVEHTLPSTLDDIRSADTASLEAMVQERRARRLTVVPSPESETG